MTVVGALISLVLVVIASFFLAADPGIYCQGFVKLFPKCQHGRVDGTLRACTEGLHLWFLAACVWSMMA